MTKNQLTTAEDLTLINQEASNDERFVNAFAKSFGTHSHPKAHYKKYKTHDAYGRSMKRLITAF
jgi:hypothetical protein